MGAQGFTIMAAAYKSGPSLISIVHGRSAATASETLRDLSNSPASRIDDWQVAEASDLKEVRSVIMSEFGLGWFNRARKQIAELSEPA